MFVLRGVGKTFGAFKALDGVDFQIGAGEIVGLLGENGAGKSTLLGVMSGNLAPSSGTLLWNGQPLQLHSPRDATALGIGIVHQHFQLVPSFSVAENIALAAPHASFNYSPQEWEKRISGWARELGWQIEPARKVEELGVGQRQRVEILKALHAHADGAHADNDENDRARVLLLDEPTANLTPGETDELFEVLRRLKARGCAIVFVSHKLGEVLALCERVTVLRHGRNAGQRAIEQTDADDLAQLMVGKALTRRDDALAQPPPSGNESASGGESALQINNLSHGILRDFSLQIRRGEIVGLAGVDGNGQAELVEVLSGLARQESGDFSPSGAGAIAVIPADRQHVGLIPPFTLYENLALHPSLRAQCKKPLRFDWEIARARTRELMEKFDVRAPQTLESTPASQLSGGNQQKLVIARALSFPHSVVVAADPTRGLDVAATRFVHEQLQHAAQAGAGVLLISSDLDEILALSHRIGALYEGRLLPAENLLPRGASREEIGKLMGGFSKTERQGNGETGRRGDTVSGRMQA